MFPHRFLQFRGNLPCWSVQRGLRISPQAARTSYMLPVYRIGALSGSDDLCNDLVSADIARSTLRTAITVEVRCDIIASRTVDSG